MAYPKVSNKLDSILIKLALNNLDSIKFNTTVGGGIAVQHYLPSELHRYTSDLDLNPKTYLNSATFKENTKNFVKALEKEGCQINIGKEHYTYDLEVTNDEQKLIIQTSRRSQAGYEKNKESIVHESDNAIEKVAENGNKYKIFRAEDLILRKASRIVEFMKNYKTVRMPEPQGGGLEKELDELSKEREAIYKNFDNINVEEVIKLRIHADTYDLSTLDLFTELNKDYFDISRSKRRIRDNDSFDAIIKKFAPKLYFKKD